MNNFKIDFKCDLNREVDVAVANVCRQYGLDKPEGLLYDDTVEQLSNGLSEAYDAAEVKPDEELKDYCSEEYAEADWSVIVDEVKEHFGLNKADIIAIKVDEYVRYGVVDTTYYVICKADDLYRFLADIVDGSDCKNGCQLYTDHFRITGGACFDPKTDKQVGFRITKVYFKEIAW